MKYRLLAIDVDGTLLDEKHTLSEKNRQAILKVQKKGGKVVLFSGRGYTALCGLMESLEMKDAVVTQNGSLILDSTGTKHLREELISVEDCRRILAYCRKHGYEPLIYQGKQIYGGLRSKYLQIFETCMNQKVVYTEDIELCYEGEPLGKILVLDEPERIRQIQEWIAGNLENKVSAELAYDFSLEIGGSDKGRALEWLASYYQIPREEVMAIGDGENDKNMLKYAGLGIAMQDAMESVKSAADEVTLSNNDNGVAFAIENYM